MPIYTPLQIRIFFPVQTLVYKKKISAPSRTRSTRPDKNRRASPPCTATTASKSPPRRAPTPAGQAPALSFLSGDVNSYGHHVDELRRSPHEACRSQIQKASRLTFRSRTLIFVLTLTSDIPASVASICTYNISKCSSRRVNHFIPLHHFHLSSS